MTMPSSEPSPQTLSERSASFNRAEFNKSMRTKGSNTGDAESIENLMSTKSSAHHIRHSSLDSSHPSALHPINLNSKFDYLFSTLWPVKASAIISVDQSGKESSFFSASDNQKEGGGETQEELILDPHESLLQDVQEESFSTSMSAGSKSPREDLNFILWGNAAFCLPEARDLSMCNKTLGLRRQTERSFGEILKKQNNISIAKKNHQLHSNDGILCSPARDGSHVFSNDFDQNDHVVAPTVDDLSSNTSKEAFVGQNEESIKCQSSVGSTLSICNISAERCAQALDLTESSAQKPLMSSEAQSYCLDFEVQGTEGSASWESKMQAESLQEEGSSKEGNDDEEEVANICNQEVTQIGVVSPLQLYNEVHQGFSLASEEVKIRAELELEIEKDLEQEIRTKIYLLSRRLEELQVLKATRDTTQEQSVNQGIEVGSCMPSLEKKETIVIKGTREAPRPKSPAIRSQKIRATIEQSSSGSHVDRMSACTTSASSKRQLPNVEKDGLSNHANIPLARLRKFAMVSGSAPHTKENSSQLPAFDGCLQNIKITKNSIEGVASGKSKLQVEHTPSFKQDYQGWTVSSSAKKFDWTRTLRSDVACTPRVSSMKKDVEEASPFLLPTKEPLHGNVSRTLFLDEGLSAPPKKTPLKIEKREGLMTPIVGSLKKSAFLSCKTNGDLVPSTPRIRNSSSGLLTHDTAIRSVSAKQVTSQKPRLGIHTPSPLHKTPDFRQTRIVTPSIPRVPPQQASSKLGKTEKTSIEDTLSSPTCASLKNTSSTHAEKVKRSASAPPSVPVRIVNSKDSKSALPKTLPKKQVGSLQQTAASRIAPSPKPATSSSQISKGRIGVPSDSVSKRSSSTWSKLAGATRGKWY